MLLSRTAENLYWFGRHLERSEAIARVVREHTNLLVDLPVSVESDWSCLLAITGTDAEFLDRYEAAGERRIVSYLIADIGNPTSVIRTVAAARDNLRNTRQVLPRSVWECVSRLHTEVATTAGSCVQRSARLDLADRIIASNQQIAGLLDSTMSHDEAFMMIQLGRLVERADMTTRVLDIRAVGLIPESTPAKRPAPDRSPYEEVRWMGVLRALGAHHMYARTAAGQTDAESVVGFLVDDAGFPRTVRHCVGQAADALAALPARDRIDRALAALGVVIERRPGAFGATELHNWIDRCQGALCDLHTAIADEFFVVTDRAEPAPQAARVARRSFG